MKLDAVLIESMTFLGDCLKELYFNVGRTEKSGELGDCELPAGTACS